MSEVTIKLDSPIITTDKSISEITTDGLANTGEIALATDGIVGNVNGALRKYPNPIKTFYVEKFVATGMAKWGFEPKDVKTNDVVMIKTATENLMFTVAEATESKAILCAFTKNGGTRIVTGQKVGSALISYSYERVADYYSGIKYEYSLSEDLSLTGVTPFTKIEGAEQCVPSYYTNHSSGKNYLRLKYNSEELLPIGASYNNSSGHSCVFYFIINHKGQQKLVVFQVSAFLPDDPITTSLSFVDLVRIEALDNGDASASFVAGRNLKVNGWEFYWKDVWEESEPSAIKHIESAGVNAAINEIKGTGLDVSAFTFPTTKDEFIAYLKTITFDFSNQPNQVSGYGSVTYGIMNKNAGTTTIVEGMGNAVPNKIHRSHIEGQHMTFPDVEYALDCHVEGQDCNIVGYASICHLEGNSNATVHSMNPNAGFGEEASGCHVEGGHNVVGGENSHAEGQYNAALGTASHCEGNGFYKDYITDWKQRTYRDNDYIVSKWKETPLGKKEGETEFHYKFSAAIAPFSHIEGMGNITEKCEVKFSGLDTGVKTVYINGSNHAEGVGNYNGGAASHVEGIRNEINKDAYASHAEGIKNTTQNRAEHASGQYNKSSKATDTFGDAGNTLFSVGCGTSDADRKNAFEVMQDGTCKYLDVATGEQIDVGVAKELSKPFDLTIGSTTKKVDGKSAVSFNVEEFGIQDKSNFYLIDVSSGTLKITLNANEEANDVEEYVNRFKHLAMSSELGFDGGFYLNCTLHFIYGDDDRNALLDLTGVGRLADRIVKIFLEYKTVYNSNSNTYKLLDQPERYSIKQFENYELVLSDYTTIDTTNSILPTTKAEWMALRNEPDLPIILKLSIGTYKCVGVTETGGVYHFEFILNNQDAQSQFGVYKFIVDTTPDTITQTVEYIDRMPKSTVNAFNRTLIQQLTTASTGADIREAFINTKNHATEFPTPGSIISKLDGGNRGIVVSLSEPDATTLGRTITVYHGNDTYTITVKSDFTKVLMPWSKISSKRNVYTNDLKQLNPEYDEARIKDYLTPQVYRKYRIVYPVKPQTGDLMEEYHNDELRYVAIKVVRNEENPNEYTDILIPESGTANAYTRIVLKNDLTAIKSHNPYYILKTCKRAYDGDLLLALDTVKAETIENSITEAYSFSIEGINTQLAAQLPEVGDLIETYGEVAPVCEVLLGKLGRYKVQHTRWFAKGKLYEVTVDTALTRVPEDPKVIYDTTSGTLRDLYVSAGAKYNEATGFYELNGLTDITEEQMRVIYEKTWGWWLHLPSLNGFGSALPRTNIPCPDFKIIQYASNISLRSIFCVSGNDDNLEVVNLRALYTPTNFDEINIVDFDWAFGDDKKIREVQGIINIKEARYNQNIGGNIETINIKGLKVSIKFYNSKRLSKESVLYMINNSEATTAITIGLNKEVYDGMKDDADIIAALAEKTNITIIQNT